MNLSFDANANGILRIHEIFLQILNVAIQVQGQRNSNIVTTNLVFFILPCHIFLKHRSLFLGNSDSGLPDEAAGENVPK